MSTINDAAEKHDHNTVRIHIDETAYGSPNPTTGEALYELGHVKPGLDLFREVTGDRENPAIQNGPEQVHLKGDEHFHSGPPKDFTIIVNGRKKIVPEKELSFDQVVALAFNPVRTEPDVLYTVTYGRGPKANPEGSLLPSGKVKLKDGMVFIVTETDKS